MDKFSKITMGYISLTVILGLLIALPSRLVMLAFNYVGFGALTPIMAKMVNPVAGFLTGSHIILLLSHIAYLKIFLDEVLRRNDSRFWLVFTGITLQIGALGYLIHRRS